MQEQQQKNKNMLQP